MGAEHVAQVEALREKRAFDAALPPLDDLERLPLRLALVQQWEAREWEGREADLEVVQQQQLELMERKILVTPGASCPCCMLLWLGLCCCRMEPLAAAVQPTSTRQSSPGVC